MTVVACPVTVPRCTVQNSRKTFRFPITSVVGSPLYFRSCGGPPRAASGQMRLSSPIVAGPSRTAWAPTDVRAPIVTFAPTIA